MYSLSKLLGEKKFLRLNYFTFIKYIFSLSEIRIIDAFEEKIRLVSPPLTDMCKNNNIIVLYA